MTMTKRDDTSMAEQNAEIRRWAEENGLTLGSRLGQQSDAVERVAPRVPVVEVTVRIDEDVYEAAMLRATYDGYDWPGLVLWTGCFEGCWLLLVVLCPLACVLVG